MGRFPRPVLLLLPTTVFILVLLIVADERSLWLCSSCCYASDEVATAPSAAATDGSQQHVLDGGPRNATIGKATMLYGQQNPVYERALQTHLQHADMHGYPVFILREKLLGRLWTKAAYVLSIILNELQKPTAERLQWLFWFDADTVLLNPYLPLEMFLPPSPEFDHISFMCGVDHNGLNDGAFLIRINEYSLHLMAASLTVESFRPEVDLKYSVQSAEEHIISSHDKINPQQSNFTYSDGYARVPQRWFNAYMGPRTFAGEVKSNRQITGNSVHEGDLLVHFVGGATPEVKVKRMKKFLDAFKTTKEAWEIPANETGIEREVQEFWRMFGKGPGDQHGGRIKSDNESEDL
ncbi:uncharacterized protein AB675_4322 [Cyphellophora attinorum]|uniref:Alpha-1,2-galactosyltransferase n=1 Tax=Cyphellophora attinorum TaxID=1664694 RepID=A0A0N0NJ57_9EURO|nr:uncharacterized protein AB675_4322 [Phialophora attinorum]KPI36601.1 hypothetical protein AB675_4322 [Phialophora attinorum]